MKRGCYSNFDAAIAKGRNDKAVEVLLREAGRLIVEDRNNFVAMMNDCGIPASVSMSDNEIIDYFLDEINDNPKLMLGCSMLIAEHNAPSNFDGRAYDQRVKDGYKAFRGYVQEDDEDYYNMAVDPISAIAQATGQVAQSGAQIATKAMEGSQKKKYGAQDYAMRSKEAQTALIQGVLGAKASQSEADRSRADQNARTTRTILIATGVIVGVAIIGTVIYLATKKKKS